MKKSKAEKCKTYTKPGKTNKFGSKIIEEASYLLYFYENQCIFSIPLSRLFFEYVIFSGFCDGVDYYRGHQR